MGIILLTELGKTPWQLRFSPFSLLPAVSQLRLPFLGTDPPLDTIPVVPSATPTGAPRASLPTGDTVDTVMVSTRGRLSLLTMVEPPPMSPSLAPTSTMAMV